MTGVHFGWRCRSRKGDVFTTCLLSACPQQIFKLVNSQHKVQKSGFVRGNGLRWSGENLHLATRERILIVVEIPKASVSHSFG